MSKDSPLYTVGTTAVLTTVAALLSANSLFLANWSCIDTKNATTAVVTNTVCRDLKAHHSDEYDAEYSNHEYDLIATFMMISFVLCIVCFLGAVMYGYDSSQSFRMRSFMAMVYGLTLVVSCLGWFIFLTHHPAGDAVIADTSGTKEEHTGQGVYSAVFASVLLVVPFVGSIIKMES